MAVIYSTRSSDFLNLEKVYTNSQSDFQEGLIFSYALCIGYCPKAGILAVLET